MERFERPWLARRRAGLREPGVPMSLKVEGITRVFQDRNTNLNQGVFNGCSIVFEGFWVIKNASLRVRNVNWSNMDYGYIAYSMGERQEALSGRIPDVYLVDGEVERMQKIKWSGTLYTAATCVVEGWLYAGPDTVNGNAYIQLNVAAEKLDPGRGI